MKQNEDSNVESGPRLPNDDCIYVDKYGWFCYTDGTFVPVDYGMTPYEVFDTNRQTLLNKYPAHFEKYDNCFGDGISQAQNYLGHWEVGSLLTVNQHEHEQVVHKVCNTVIEEVKITSRNK